MREDPVMDAILEDFERANEVCGDPVAASILIVARHIQGLGLGVNHGILKSSENLCRELRGIAIASGDE